jgi:hypothetical protein
VGIRYPQPKACRRGGATSDRQNVPKKDERLSSAEVKKDPRTAGGEIPVAAPAQPGLRAKKFSETIGGGIYRKGRCKAAEELYPRATKKNESVVVWFFNAERKDMRGCRSVAFNRYKRPGLSRRPFVFIENLLSTLILLCRISFRLKRCQAGFEI